MQQIRLGDSGRMTTRLGFGCSSVMGALNRRESLSMLEAAVEAGIQHFDVAPSYGYGQAEGCLGELLARHRSALTVTTKFGIAPPKAQSFAGIARGLVKPILRSLPGLKTKLAGLAGKAIPAATPAIFNVDEAGTSLEASLRALGVERVDVFLLHEATANDLVEESLLRFLEDSVAAGKIGTFGIGSEGAKIPALLEACRPYCRVVQYEWSVLDEPVAAESPFRIHHRALTQNFRQLHLALTSRPEVCRRWSDRTQQDLANAGSLSRLMLKASLVLNPESVVLFSSKSAAHIRANAMDVSDSSLEDGARLLARLVREEGTSLGL